MSKGENGSGPTSEVRRLVDKRRNDISHAVSQALDLIGERWALLVVHQLLSGPLRFTELRAALSGISSNVLAQRLKGLERSSIVVRRRLPSPASVWVYDLTEWGRELETALIALHKWALRPGTDSIANQTQEISARPRRFSQTEARSA
jgi:DNA-binding HxlR family transcriptional regulator